MCDFHAHSILDEAWRQKWRNGNLKGKEGKSDEDNELYDLVEEKGGTVSRISSGAPAGRVRNYWSNFFDLY